MERRGRPTRAGAYASNRVEIRLTDVEFDAAERFARANGIGLAEAFRLALNWLAAALEEDDDPPLVLGNTVLITKKPDPSPRELLPGKNPPSL